MLFSIIFIYAVSILEKNNLKKKKKKRNVNEKLFDLNVYVFNLSEKKKRNKR